MCDRQHPTPAAYALAGLEKRARSLSTNTTQSEMHAKKTIDTVLGASEDRQRGRIFTRADAPWASNAHPIKAHIDCLASILFLASLRSRAPATRGECRSSLHRVCLCFEAGLSPFKTVAQNRTGDFGGAENGDLEAEFPVDLTRPRGHQPRSSSLSVRHGVRKPQVDAVAAAAIIVLVASAGLRQHDWQRRQGRGPRILHGTSPGSEGRGRRG